MVLGVVQGPRLVSGGHPSETNPTHRTRDLQVQHQRQSQEEHQSFLLREPHG